MTKTLDVMISAGGGSAQLVRIDMSLLELSGDPVKAAMRELEIHLREYFTKLDLKGSTP